MAIHMASIRRILCFTKGHCVASPFNLLHYPGYHFTRPLGDISLAFFLEGNLLSLFIFLATSISSKLTTNIVVNWLFLGFRFNFGCITFLLFLWKIQNLFQLFVR